MNALPGCATIIELDFVCCHNAGDHSPSARRRRSLIKYRRLFPMSGHSKWNNIKRKKEKTDGAKA